MRQDGVITRWDDERGFGFITPALGGPQVFVHVSECPRTARPVAGAAVTFLAARDHRNRLRASEVKYVRPVSVNGTAGRGVGAAAAVSLSFLALLGLLAVMELLPILAPAISGLLSALAVALYRADKAAAIRGDWRISESALQFVSLLGGWPGALLAQRLYRHKTRKQPFQTQFWIGVVVNCAVLAWLAIGQPFPL